MPVNFHIWPFTSVAIYRVGRQTQTKLNVCLPGPCGIPENTGILRFDSNTDTGIFENKIPVFFGILYSTQDNVFKYVYWFLDNFGDFWGLPELLKVFQV